MALRYLARDISKDGFVMPIIEPINENSATLKSIGLFMEEEMPFLLICNPRHGKLSDRGDFLQGSKIESALQDYDCWIPTLCIDGSTTVQEFLDFVASYYVWDLAVIYYGKPEKDVISEIEITVIKYHVFLEKPKMPKKYRASIPALNKVYIQDPFERMRNADYPRGPEPFTDMNTKDGNPENVNFGDYSIVGNYYSETGSPPHAIALHHIHLADDSNCLELSHFKSDRKETANDPSGKIREAVSHLVQALPDLDPNNTAACSKYKEIHEEEISTSPAFMKRLAIKHHLEVVMSRGVLELKF